MTSEQYLAHAEECDRLAAMATLEANRQALLSSAEMWRKLAAPAKPGDGAGSRFTLGRPPGAK